jgi:hypothetical protein
MSKEHAPANENFFEAKEIDPIHSLEVVAQYGISQAGQLALLDTGKACAYQRYKAEPCLVYEDMPGPPPHDRDSSKVQYRRLHHVELGRLTADKISDLYLSKTEIDSAMDTKTELQEQDISQSQSKTKAAYKIVAEILRSELLEFNSINPSATAKQQHDAIWSSGKVTRAIRENLGDRKIKSVRDALRRLELDDGLPKHPGGRPSKTVR